MSGNDKAGPSRRRPPLQDNGSGQFACGDKVDERELEQVGFRDLPLRPQACAADYTLCILAHAVPKSETPPLEVELLVVVAEENNLPQSVNASGEEVMELDKMWRIHRSLYPLTFKPHRVTLKLQMAQVAEEGEYRAIPLEDQLFDIDLTTKPVFVELRKFSGVSNASFRKSVIDKTLEIKVGNRSGEEVTISQNSIYMLEIQEDTGNDGNAVVAIGSRDRLLA